MLTIGELEKRFNRAMRLSFSKKKFIITFPALMFSAIFILFSLAIPLEDGWMRLSLIFLSIFLASSIQLALGVFLIRIYYHEVKNINLSIIKIFSKSFEIIIGASYLTFPLIIIFSLLWVMLGIFNFLSKIPKFGLIIDSILAFAPFMLIFGLVFLCFVNICILFFVTPPIGLKIQKKLTLAKELIERIKMNFFEHFLAFFIGILPIIMIVLMLLIAVNLTSYFSNLSKVTNFVRAFFLSLPINLILSPFIIFFFNFAAEMHQLSLKK